LLPLDWQVATIDCTLKIVDPAVGGRLVGEGRVVKRSRLLTVSSADVFVESGGRRELSATALVTTRNIEPRAYLRYAPKKSG
jgi:acyl-coenzyme A thioesterase PaaI-like protein